MDFFTSDLHLGHRLVSKVRGFSSTDTHDDFVLDQLSNALTKDDKLYILGDIAFPRRVLPRLKEVRCASKHLIFGNHDNHKATDYLAVFNRIWGAKEYKSCILSHIPIHPQELLRFKVNIHGHIHVSGCTPNPTGRYLNVNLEFHEFQPVPFSDIETIIELEGWGDEDDG